MEKTSANVPAVEIGVPRVRSYVTARLDVGASRATVRYETVLLKQMLALAHEAGQIPAVPPIKALKLKDENARQTFATPRQFWNVIGQLDRSKVPNVRALAPLFTAAGLMGWRTKSELCTLEWRDVDLRAQTITLSATKSKNRRARVYPYGLFPALAAVIQERREATTAYERASGRVVSLVFWRGDGKPINHYRRAWQVACERALVPWLNPRDLRRTAARLHRDAGTPKDILKRLVGWETDAMLERYGIIVTDDLERGAGAFGAFLKRAHGIDSRHELADEESEAVAAAAGNIMQDQGIASGATPRIELGTP